MDSKRSQNEHENEKQNETKRSTTTSLPLFLPLPSPLPTLLPAPPPRVSLPLLPSSRSSSFRRLIIYCCCMRRMVSAQTTCLWTKLHTTPQCAHTLPPRSFSMSAAACGCIPGSRVHARWAPPRSRARTRGKKEVGRTRARPAGAVTARPAEFQLRVPFGAKLDRAAP